MTAEQPVPSLPSVEPTAQPSTRKPKKPKQSEAQKPKTAKRPTKPKPQKLDVTTASVTVPMVHVEFGYASRNVYVDAMSGEQRQTLKQILVGLMEDNATLVNGKKVKSLQDAVKWMLENVA